MVCGAVVNKKGPFTALRDGLVKWVLYFCYTYYYLYY
jgi:hypothetical protein